MDGERAAFALGARARLGQVVQAQHHVLRGHGDRLRRAPATECCSTHSISIAGFDLRFRRQRNVHRHLVAVEVGVERRADQRMDLDGLAFHQHRLERLNAQAVQRGSAVEQHRVVLDDFFQDVPNHRVLLLHHFLGLLDGGAVAALLQPVIDERLEQFERHLLRQAALVQLQLRARPRSPNGRSSPRACPAGSGGSGPACPSACRRATSAGGCWRRAARGRGGRCRTARPPLPAACASRCARSRPARAAPSASSSGCCG